MFWGFKFFSSDTTVKLAASNFVADRKFKTKYIVKICIAFYGL